MALDLAKLRTIRQFTNENPAFTNDYLHYLISKGAHNGIETCLVRIGAKVLIDTEAFAAWLETQPGIHGRGGSTQGKKQAALAVAPAAKDMESTQV
jgi:hypothetical protein